MSNISPTLLNQIQEMNVNEKLELMVFLANSIKNNQNYSAEMKAEIRLKDELNEDKWITTIDENEEIDEEELNNWVKNYGK